MADQQQVVKAMLQPIQWNRVEAVSDPLRVSCDSEGPSIGPIRLLRRTPAGLKPRETQELDFLLRRAFGHPISISHRIHSLNSVVSALGKGDLAYAILLTQFMSLPSLPDNNAFNRAIEADALIKAGFKPDQSRDAQGRWTVSGGQGASYSQKPPAGFQYTSGAVCSNCHAVIPPVPPPWQGPFDDLLFGPQLTKPNSSTDDGFHDALMACHQVCLDRYVKGTLGGSPGIRGADQPTNYRRCMRECLSERGYENF